MRRHTPLGLALASTGAAILTPAAATAAPGPSHASCAAVVTTFETRIAPGFVGEEVAGLAKDAASYSALVRNLAHTHDTLEGCVEAL